MIREGMSEEDKDYLSAKTKDVVLAAMGGNDMDSVQHIADIGQRLGVRGVYALCFLLAETIIALGDLRVANLPADAAYGFQVAKVSLADGSVERVNPEAIGACGMDPIVAATRFLVARLNNDDDACLDVLVAAKDPEQRMDLPVGLLSLVAQYPRARLAEVAMRAVTENN